MHKNLLERFIRSATSKHAQKRVGATLPFLTKVDGDDGWEQHDWPLTDVAVDRWPISCSLAGPSAGELIAADEAPKPDQRFRHARVHGCLFERFADCAGGQKGTP